MPAIGLLPGPAEKTLAHQGFLFFSFIITMIFITTSISISIIIIFFFYCDNKWRKMNSPTSHILPIHTEHWSTSYPWPLSDDGNVAIDYAQTVAIGICFQKSVDGDGSMLSYQ
jgi:hypothetical protein